MEHFTPSEAPIHETQRLPVMPPPQIIGRNQVLGQTFAQMRAGAAVLLHGPEGVGKSALAATLAAAFTTFPGGVLWWSVNRDSLAQLVVRLGRAYGERAISDRPDPLSQMDVVAALLDREHKPMVVLDGALDLEVGRDFVRKVVPGVPVILTNESAGPGPWTPFEIRELTDDDAATLFIQTAGYEQVSNLMRADIQGVCNALGGQPLAIILAGRHVRAEQQTPGEFLGALTTSGLTGALLALTSIFHQLPDALQGMLLTIGSTFAGRATSTLLEYLQLSPHETVVRVMEMLAARGLVQRVVSQTPLKCYQLHVVIHRFAQSWLRDMGRLETTVARVQEALLSYAEQYSTETREARAALVAEMDNFMGLARYAAASDDITTVERLATALARAFGPTGGYGYELHLLEQLTGGTLAEEAAAVAQMPLFADEQALPSPPDVSSAAAPPPGKVRPPAEGAYDTLPLEPLESKLAAGPPPDAAQVPARGEEAGPEPAPVWAAESEAGEAIEAGGAPADQILLGAEVDDLLAAAEAAREAGRWEEAIAALNALGQRLLEQDRSEEAQEAFAEALAIGEDVEDMEGMLVALEGLAGVSLDDGDLDNAIVYATRAENLAAQGRDPARHGHLLALLGDVQMEAGELDHAIGTYVNAIETLQATGDELSLGIVQTKLGNAQLDRGDYSQAVTMLTEALAVFERQGRLDYQGRVLGNLGTACGRMGQWADAEEYHRQAAAIAQQLGDIEEQERQLANLAYAAQARGDREAMISYYRQALDLAYRAGVVVWQVRYLDVLGRMLMDDVSQVNLAVMVLEEADELVPSDDRIRWLQRARKRLERIQESGIPQQPLPSSVRQWAAEASSGVEAGAGH